MNTNKKGYLLYKDNKAWKDITLSHLYAYLAVLFYMGIHVENDTRAYWSRREDRPVHILVHIAIGENRWHRIHCAFSIADPNIQAETIYERVEPLNSYIWTTSRQYWILG